MANTYPTTQFPLGSTEVKVLFNNASNFDDAMNSELPSFYDRFNKRRETWAGMQKMVADFLEAMGFEATHLVYVDGTPLTVLRPTQLIDRAGSVYKVKQPATFPVELSGTWATDQLLLVDVGDASLRMALASSTGAGMIGFGVQTAEDKFNEIKSFEDFGAVGDLIADDTAALQAAAASGRQVFGSGKYLVSGQIDLVDNTCFIFTSNARVKQTTVNTTTFKAIQKDNVWLHCNRALFESEGTWSGAWTGMGGHDDRMIQLWGCTNSGATLPRIRNCGSAGIAIFGGENITIHLPVIEGTHLYSTPIPLLGNFQVGIYIRDETTYGICDNLLITSPNISGVAQGILSELYSAASIVSRAHQIPNAIIHDIPGQHAFYIQGGALNCDGAVITNTGLAGVKIQSADSNAAIRSFSAQGITANGIGSNLFEMNCTGTGSVNGVLLSGTVDGCAVGLACNGTIRDLHADLVVTNATSNAVLIQGDGAKDIDVTVTGQTIGDDGVLITATNATGIRVRPNIRDCNQNSNVTGSGVLVQSASAEVTLFDPVMTDITNKMTYGLFNSTLGSTVRVLGSIVATGATAHAVRADGKITEFPIQAILQGTANQFSGIGNVTSSGPMKSSLTTASATNQVLWQENIPVNTLVSYRIRVTAKLVTSAEFRVLELVVSAYRSGTGNATFIAAPVVNVDQFTGGSTAAYTLAVNGADGIALNVNSGGVATYNWTAEVEAVRQL